MNVIFREEMPIAALRPWVRRAMIGFSEKPVREILPIRSTGFAYFTFTNIESGMEIQYEHQSIKTSDEIHIANQLTQNNSQLNFNGKVIHIGLEILPSLPQHLFNLSGEFLLNNGISYKTVNAKEYQALVNTIKTDLNPERISKALQEFLLMKIKEKKLKAGIIEKVLQLIYDQNGFITVPKLAEENSISERTLRRYFKKVIGLAPKYYAKIVQLNHVFDAIKTNNEKEIYKIALEAGYYDQSHFINDFQKYIGQSPNDFLQAGHYFLKTYLGKVRFE